MRQGAVQVVNWKLVVQMTGLTSAILCFYPHGLSNNERSIDKAPSVDKPS